MYRGSPLTDAVESAADTRGIALFHFDLFDFVFYRSEWDCLITVEIDLQYPFVVLRR